MHWHHRQVRQQESRGLPTGCRNHNFRGKNNFHLWRLLEDKSWGSPDSTAVLALDLLCLKLIPA